jgi:hypothetical protein
MQRPLFNAALLALYAIAALFSSERCANGTDLCKLERDSGDPTASSSGYSDSRSAISFEHALGQLMHIEFAHIEQPPPATPLLLDDRPWQEKYDAIIPPFWSHLVGNDLTSALHRVARQHEVSYRMEWDSSARRFRFDGALLRNPPDPSRDGIFTFCLGGLWR